MRNCKKIVVYGSMGTYVANFTTSEEAATKLAAIDELIRLGDVEKAHLENVAKINVERRQLEHWKTQDDILCIHARVDDRGVDYFAFYQSIIPYQLLGGPASLTHILNHKIVMK